MKNQNDKLDRNGKIEARQAKGKAAMIEAMGNIEIQGNVTLATESVGISRQLHYDWLEADFEYKVAIEEAVAKSKESFSGMIRHAGITLLRLNEPSIVRFYEERFNKLAAPKTEIDMKIEHTDPDTLAEAIEAARRAKMEESEA